MKHPLNLAILTGISLLCLAPQGTSQCETKLTASDGAPGDELANTTGISGDTILLGTLWDDDAGINAGSAYVYVRSGMEWIWQAKLLAEDAAPADLFGCTVALSGDTALVGAFFDDDAGSSSGSAYVFVRDGSHWSQQAKLVASDAASGDQFGIAALDGDTALVGSFRDDDAGPNSGSAYVFVRQGTSWSQQAKLVASDASQYDNFGRGVHVSGDTIIVGANAEDDPGGAPGAAYVFVWNGTRWSEQAKLTGDAGVDYFDGFGSQVAIDGETTAVGAPYDRTADDGAGAAYVFVRDGATWMRQAKLLASDGEAGDRFGLPVISGDTVVIGAPADDSVTGSAYVFVRRGTIWSEETKLQASDGEPGDHFSNGNSISGDLVTIACPYDDDMGYHAGAAYIYDLACLRNFDSPLRYCIGKTTSQSCVPFLDSVGTPSTSDTGSFMVRGNDFAPANGGVLIYGYAKSNLNYHGGKLCIKAPIRTAGKKVSTLKGAIACTTATSTGRLTTDFNAHIQSGVDPILTSGQLVFVQWYQRDPANTIAGFADALSDGMRFTIVP